MTRALSSTLFWTAFLITALVSGLFFAWETNLLSPFIPGPIRPEVTTEEIVFSVLIVFLLAFDTGLFFWRKRYGSCPAGVKRATGIGAAFGALALLCPACTVLPLALLGAGVTLGFITPFLPLLRLVTVIILATVAWMLWPRK